MSTAGMTHRSQTDQDPPALRLAPWLRRLGWAVWVSGPDQRITWMSKEAEELLGKNARDCLDLPCHQVVEARDEEGAPFCCAPCPMTELGNGDRPRKPVHVTVQRVGHGRRWLEFMAIPVEGNDEAGHWFLHCARDVSPERDMAGYLERVATRSDRRRSPQELTPREEEVLSLLSKDLELRDIASRLRISRVTVRNHVQHILGKLGAHSIQEAVAMHLTGRAT